MRQTVKWIAAGALVFPLLAGVAWSSGDDKEILSGLDAQYQAAVRAGDLVTMDRLLADDFVLVTGRGRVYTKAQLIEEARDSGIVYEHQEDTSRVVRIWGNTAVVTAFLWEKGVQRGRPFDYKVWFSDTYVRTATGWRYVFGQSSLPLAVGP